MGALTSLTKWIPEDDLLLKNAVESGASLESLAKGAVQFSRRYTIRELRDRWHSLLYDLDTSIEASTRMVAIEIELAASNLPKATRACNTNSKGKEIISYTKRKADSVRNHYYAMRKRVRSTPTVNLSYSEPHALLAATECDNISREHLMADSNHPADNFGLEVPFAEDYGHPETGHAGAQHVFPELMRVDPAAANGDVLHQAYNAGHEGPVEDVIPDGPSGEGCLIAYPENISSMLHDEAEGDNGNQSFERNFQQRDFPNILGENLIDTSSEIHEIAQSNALGTSSLYKEEDIGAKTLAHFDSSNNSCEDFRTDFVRKDNLSQHVPEDGGSFHQPSTYVSRPTGMPMWRTMEGSSTSTMPTEGHYGDKTQRLLQMDDHKNINAPVCDVASSDTKLDDMMCGDGLNNPSMIPENDFIDFPDTYMDFDDDEGLLFMDVNEKDNQDKSCVGLTSILLNSPSDTHCTSVINNELGPTNASDACLEIPDATCSRDLNVVSDQMYSQLHDGNTNYGIKVTSRSSDASNTIKLREELMICVVNSEDTEVPNNDHVIFPDPAFPPFSSNMKQSTNGVSGLVSADNILSPNERDLVGGSRKAEEHASNLQPTLSSLKVSPLSLPKAGVLQSCDVYAGGAEPPEDGSMAGCPTYAGNGVDEAKPCRSETIGLNSTSVASIKEETTVFCFENQDNADNSFASFLESHLQETDDAKIHPVNAMDGFPDEADIHVGLQTCLPMQPDVNSAEPVFFDAVAMVSASDQEEQFSDSEDGVPYFSDIEALILDMDLGQYDQESLLLSKEESRYQHIDPKNTIRWEQSFISCTNRSISSHGAFAVFYGRHLKYFIKDTEVSIGRETEDVKVDIDLGREGRANKISRRQAIIKMDENGSFSLKNIGKFPIYVNGQTVPARNITKLLPHSLVKIQDMHFAFEVNERAVRQYIKKMHGSCQDRSTFRFESV